MKDTLNTSAPVIEARDLNLVFQTGDGPVHVLKDVNLSINRGEFVSFIGPSGCGKTTFLWAIEDGVVKTQEGHGQFCGTATERGGE
jgi:NitT/TauT family transport system ATP-binding protein